jgi:tRNA modification GTPase
VLFLHDLTRIADADYIAGDATIVATLTEKLAKTVQVIDVWNKADAVSAAASQSGITLSTKTGQGLDELRSTLLKVAGWQATTDGVFIARERHLQALRRVDAHLEAAHAHLMQRGQSLDLLAEELRLGQNALSDITGEFSSDDLLGVIFSKFCIGK